MTASTHDGLIAGRYRLGAPLGSGGTATVYRGQDILLDREVAVKKLTLPPIADADAYADAVERTFREVRAAARIRHPGVAAVYDFVSEGSPYIVMQLIEGYSLADEIAEQGPLPPSRVADIGRQLLAALVAGHVVGVLHRDVKPANVLITDDGQAVLTDFGIAALDGEPSLTRTGIIIGTPGYMAPERANGLPATPAADLWSLGATLYAALSGRGPFDDRGEALATLHAIASEDPPRIAGEGPVIDIVNALLCREPAGRPTFAEIARALDAAAGPERQHAPAPRPHRPWREQDPRLDTPVPARDDRADRGSGPIPAGRTGRISLILAAVAAVAIAASAMAAYLPGKGHSAQSPSGQSVRTPAPTSGRSSPALTGPAAPPPVGQQFRVAATANADGSPEVVARQANGMLTASRFAKGSWSAWTTLPGGPAYTADPAIATTKDGRLIVFARATTGQVAELWQTSPGSTTWAGPVALGTAVTRSSPAVVAWPDGRLEVFALLGDARIGYASQSATSAGGTWSGWTSLGGQVTGPPAAALDATGHPQVFAATAGHQLVHDYYRTGTWAGWAQAPGKPIYVGVPGIATNADGRLEVFSRSTNGDLLHVWQSSAAGTGWAGPGNLAVNGCSTDPAVFGAADGQHGGHLEAFCMDSTFGNSVFHTFQISAGEAGTWSAWQSLKGSSDGAVTAMQTPMITGILARTTSGAIAYQNWTAQHGWSGWSMLPAY